MEASNITSELYTMAIYTFKNKKTGKTKEYEMRISEYDQFKKDHPNLERVIDLVGVSLHTLGNKTVTEIAAKKDPGWAEVLSKIGQQNPHTQLNQDYTRNKTAKTIKAEAVVEKHAKIQAKQAQARAARR
jgi:hypothetical protein